MTELLTVAQMRAIEQAAIESGVVTGLELMERAGAGVVEAVFEEWPELAEGTHRAVVLCGPGNNGGDGFVIARLLTERGWRVDTFFYGNHSTLPPDAQTNHSRLKQLCDIHELGFPVADWNAQLAFGDAASHRADDLTGDEGEEMPPFLVVDALFGIGLTRAITGLNEVMVHMDYLAVFPDLNNHRRVAVDVASGYATDTGEMIWDTAPNRSSFPIIESDLVVTFHAAKPVHAVLQALGVKVVVKDIGLAVNAAPKSSPEARDL